MKLLKWPLLVPVFPRLALITFTFCQPLLLKRLLNYLSDPIERQNANIGYGLIGAYGAVYFGMAVGSLIWGKLDTAFSRNILSGLFCNILASTI